MIRQTTIRNAMVMSVVLVKGQWNRKMTTSTWGWPSHLLLWEKHTLRKIDSSIFWWEQRVFVQKDETLGMKSREFFAFSKPTRDEVGRKFKNATVRSVVLLEYLAARNPLMSIIRRLTPYCQIQFIGLLLETVILQVVVYVKCEHSVYHLHKLRTLTRRWKLTQSSE